jgi:hypothetical protein
MRIPLARVLVYLGSGVMVFFVAALVGASRWTAAHCGAPNFAGECSQAPVEGVFWGLAAVGGVVIAAVAVEGYLHLTRDKPSG